MLWDAETIQVDRQTKESFELNNVLSCSFALQPDLFNETISSKESMMRGSGLIARMLICAPQSTQGYRQTKVESANYHLEDFNDRIEQLCQFSLIAKQSHQSVCLEFDDDAKAFWLYAANDIERKIAPTGQFQSIKDIASKYLNNASRIAALIHFYHHGKQAGQVQSRISQAELRSALTLVEYYTCQALMLLGEKTYAQQRKIYAWTLFEYTKRNFDATMPYIEKRMICSNGPRAIRKAELAQEAIDALVQNRLLYPDTNTKNRKYWFTQYWFSQAQIPIPYGYAAPCYVNI